MTNHSRREFLLRAGGAALSLALCGEVQAHARLVRSEPKNGGELSESPKTIELWFNELLEGKFSTIELFRGEEIKKRENLLSAKPVLNARDRTQLSVEVPELKAGRYVVEYRVLSRDGHTAPGRFTFAVKEKPRS